MSERDELLDFAELPRRRGVLDPLGNALAAILFVASIAMMVILLHCMPDASDPAPQPEIPQQAAAGCSR